MVLLTALPRSLSEYTATLRGRGGFTHCVAAQPVRIYSYKTEGEGWSSLGSRVIFLPISRIIGRRWTSLNAHFALMSNKSRIFHSVVTRKRTRGVEVGCSTADRKEVLSALVRRKKSSFS